MEINNIQELDLDEITSRYFTNANYVNYEKRDKEDFEKNCSKYPYLPVILPKVKRIIVIGDLHGDLELTKQCLKIADLIDDDMNWKGNDTIVVQVGDQVDRCRPLEHKCTNPLATNPDEHSDIIILELFTKLHNQALKKGGAVYSLFGNHELMNIEGNMNYVSYKGLVGFADYKDPNNKELDFKKKYPILPDVKVGELARRHAFAPGNEYGNFLACTRVPSVIIGSFLFVHAGITPELINRLKIKGRHDLYKINFAVRRWILKLIDRKYVDQIVGSYRYAMFWHRIIGGIPTNMNNNDVECVEFLDPVLKMFNIQGMIIGHTPQFFSNHDGINSTCNEQLWRVDTGGSNAFDKFDNKYMTSGTITDMRKAQVLEIINDSNIKVLK